MLTPDHGPTGEIPDTSRHRALAAANRVRMLQLIEQAGDGVSANEVATALRLHPNTVRAHLDVLVDSGLIRRDRHTDGSPGRPAWRYHDAGAGGPEEADELIVSGGERAYRELATALVGYLSRTQAAPHEAGVEVGRAWGGGLATAGPGGDPIPGLVRALGDLGFSPRVVERSATGPAVLHLRSCPYLPLAKASPEVVCGVHLGVIGGVLNSLGAERAEADLEPFGAPGACVVRVRHPA